MFAFDSFENSFCFGGEKKKEKRKEKINKEQNVCMNIATVHALVISFMKMKHLHSILTQCRLASPRLKLPAEKKTNHFSDTEFKSDKLWMAVTHSQFRSFFFVFNEYRLIRRTKNVMIIACKQQWNMYETHKSHRQRIYKIQNTKLNLNDECIDVCVRGWPACLFNSQIHSNVFECVYAHGLIIHFYLVCATLNPMHAYTLHGNRAARWYVLKSNTDWVEWEPKFPKAIRRRSSDETKTTKTEHEHTHTHTLNACTQN